MNFWYYVPYCQNALYQVLSDNLCFQNDTHALSNNCTNFTVKVAQASLAWNLISLLPAQTDRYGETTYIKKYQRNNVSEVSKPMWLPPDECSSNNYQLKLRWRRSWDQKDTCPFLSRSCAIPGETGDPWKKTKNTIM